MKTLGTLNLAVAILTAFTSVGASAETICQDLQFNNGSEKIFVEIKNYHKSITVGDKGLVTMALPNSTQEKELTGITLQVTQMSLVKTSTLRNGVTEHLYGVGLTFPYDAELAMKYNSNSNEFYTICRVYP